MATNFPTSLDALTNPTVNDTLASGSHSAQHANTNDAIEALQVKVGVDGSAVTSSLDYKIAALQTGKSDTGHNHDGSYSALGHNHDASYAALSHDHTTLAISTSGSTRAEIDLGASQTTDHVVGWNGTKLTLRAPSGGGVTEDQVVALIIALGA